MSLTNPYRQKNYMGEYAAETGGGSVLEFIQANKWDSNADGTGDPRAGMSFFDTVEAALKGYSGTAWGVLGGEAIVSTGFGGNIGTDKTTLQAVLDEFDRPAAESIWTGSFVNSSAKIDSVRGQAQDIFSCSVYGDSGTGDSVSLTPEGVDEAMLVPLGTLVSVQGRVQAICAPIIYASPFIKIWDLDFTVYNDGGHYFLVNTTTKVVAQVGSTKTGEWVLRINIDPGEGPGFFILGEHLDEHVYLQGSLRATMLSTIHMWEPPQETWS